MFRWIGTVIVCVAGALSAMNLFPYNFIVASTGSFLLGTQSFLIKDWPIFAMNVWFTAMTCIAAINYIY